MHNLGNRQGLLLLELPPHDLYANGRPVIYLRVVWTTMLACPTSSKMLTSDMVAKGILTGLPVHLISLVQGFIVLVKHIDVLVRLGDRYNSGAVVQEVENDRVTYH